MWSQKMLTILVSMVSERNLSWQPKMKNISDLDTGLELNNAHLAKFLHDFDSDMERIITAEAERERESIAVQDHSGRTMEHAGQDAWNNLDQIQDERKSSCELQGRSFSTKEGRWYSRELNSRNPWKDIGSSENIHGS